MPKLSVKLRVLAGGWLVLGFLVASTVVAQGKVFSPESVKAAFLYRFASYVEWPADAPGDPLVIAVVGSDAIAEQLGELLPRMSGRGKSAQVRRITQAGELDGVHILYVAADAMKRTRTLRASANKRPILVVTDFENGLEQGGVINFIEANRNVRFEISLEAADRARLKINSALLSVAARVERRPQAWSMCADPYVQRYRKSACQIRIASIRTGVAR